MSNPFLADRVANGALRPFFPKNHGRPRNPLRFTRITPLGALGSSTRGRNAPKGCGLSKTFCNLGSDGAYRGSSPGSCWPPAAETSQQTAVMIDATC